ncbi:TIGR00730 family Rossman fold protein [Niveispirillum cyanobacteriorum]|uniref:Cytokinin riboside 5'-monophosphate phosphoribohydrolase n=1 Tax=Niveispirillum cyanobacteriorum TaxID=1612173 RepID=A0A2K9N9V0_9PROT|nr:TIGR00730 family Rossman fold protein [Niveispirillum cyanobacteriorum]AUN29772.1 TIGR00730 family Rossman fold protein [Niveispirillum cyanobacteriorum]GGE60910.1 cytokinin riboside 5'-monophosphate phosphoribohydrolase [Niveispirillum cyanobacteriorum]
MSSIQSVCVYCGSSDFVADSYKDAARRTGEQLAANGYDIVYGGGRVGLMGIVADAGLKGGAKVVGIIPDHIKRYEVDHTGLTELIVVESMHIRKQMMVERSDAFIILPGGIGTLDEMFEIITWRQLRLHGKPVVIINTDGFWNPLVALMEHMTETGFMRKPNLPGADDRLYHVVDSVEEAVDLLARLKEAAHKVQTDRM